MASRKRSRPDSDDESKESGKAKVGGDSITAFIRNTFNVRSTATHLTAHCTVQAALSQSTHLSSLSLSSSLCAHCGLCVCQMVSDPSTDHIVRWTDDGTAFLVLDEFAFAKQLLPLYFRHKNLSSFIRQLNFYNFKKRQVDGKYIRLQHPYFRRGQLALLQSIRRKSAHGAGEGAGGVKATVAALVAQVAELKGQYDDLFKIQQQILYIFSRYMRANPMPRSLGGGRERLMLGGEDGEEGDGGVLGGGMRGGGGGGGLLPHPNVELVEDGDDDENEVDDTRAEHDGDDNEGRVSEPKDVSLGVMDEHGEGDVEAFDDGVEVGVFDDDDEHGAGGDDEENKEASEATAQAFAELQSLQDIIDQMPGKQEFLSSIPPIPSPSDRINKRRARAASPPAASAAPIAAATASSSSGTAASAAPKYSSYAYPPPATMTTFNAFPVPDASIALPPLYPSQSYINQQAPTASTAATTASSSNATPAAPSAATAAAARNKPKLLYSQEHYDALSNTDDSKQQHDSNSDSGSSHQPHLAAFSDPYSHSHSQPYNQWPAPSDDAKEHDLFTPSNLRQSSWMPSDLPPHSPQLGSSGSGFLNNSDDSTHESDYGLVSPSQELSGHARTAASSSGRGSGGSSSGGQYGAWQPYQQF